MTAFPLLSSLGRPIVRWFRKPASVRWGDLRCTKPRSRTFGLDRGQPIDRYYIEQFVRQHEHDIRGRVLEIGDATYTRRFGGDRVAHSDVLHAAPGNPESTIIGDLATGRNVPSEAFDCIILTQTLMFIFDADAAVKHVHRALKPDGVVLATLAGVSQISRYDRERWGDYWRFTTDSARRLFVDAFGSNNVQVQAHGNVLVAIAMLQGLAAQELSQRERDYRDPDYEVLITVRGVKS